MLYPIDASRMLFEDWLGFVLGLMFAVMIHAEAQAFAATVLGDKRESSKDRFHFNPLLRLDVAGVLAFAVAGFGWPRRLDVDSSRFKRPRLGLIGTRMSGALANILMASILSNLGLLVSKLLDLDPKMFQSVIGVNVAVGAFHLFPLPPLAAASVIYVLIPEKYAGVRERVWQVFPFVLIALLLADRLAGFGLVAGYYRAVVLPVYGFFLIPGGGV